MNILISFCYVSLIFNIAVRSEDSEHVSYDSIKNNNKSVRKHRANSSKNITHDSDNDNIIGKSTPIPNILNQETSLKNVLRLRASPSFNGIPRRTIRILKNDKMQNEKMLQRAVNNILNATKIPMTVPLAEKENQRNNLHPSPTTPPLPSIFTHLGPFNFQLNDTNKPNKANASEESILNTTALSQNNAVISNNETKVIPTVETTTKSENKEEKIEKSEAIVVTENTQHESKNKHHQKHNRHNNKKGNETIKNSTDINVLPEKEEVPVDDSKNKLDNEKNNKEEPDRNIFLNLHIKLSNLDAWNEKNCKPVEIESTSPTNENCITISKNGFSSKTKELGDSSTKFEDSLILKYLRNQNSRDCNNRDLNKNAHTENKLQKSHVLYSELRPGCDKVTLDNKIFKDYEYQPKPNNLYSHYQKLPYNQQQQFQHQHFTNVPLKLKKPLILPCLQRIWNNKPYFECDLNDYSDRELKDIYSNRDLTRTDKKEMNYIKPYQNNFIGLDTNLNRNDYLGHDLEVKRNPERYDEDND